VSINNTSARVIVASLATAALLAACGTNSGTEDSHALALADQGSFAVGGTTTTGQFDPFRRCSNNGGGAMPLDRTPMALARSCPPTNLTHAPSTVNTPAQSDDDRAVHAGDVVPLYRLGHKGRTTISPTATSVCNKTSKIR
jgi:hypothetical protein